MFGLFVLVELTTSLEGNGAAGKLLGGTGRVAAAADVDGNAVVPADGNRSVAMGGKPRKNWMGSVVPSKVRPSVLPGEPPVRELGSQFSGRA